MFEEQNITESVSETQKHFATMERQAVRWGKIKRWAHRTSGICFLISLVSYILWSLEPNQYLVFGFHSTYVFAISFLSLVAGIAVRTIGVSMRPTRHNPLRQVWRTHDPQALGTLLEATQMHLPGFRNRAVGSLIDLLPKVTPDVATELTPFQRNSLIRLIGIGLSESPDLQSAKLPDLLLTESKHLIYNQDDRRAEIAITILRIISWCGSNSDLEAVRRIAEGNRLASMNAQAHEAAVKCVAILTERLKRDTYLRPAEPPAVETGILLRPRAGTQIPQDQLLRPTKGSD